MIVRINSNEERKLRVIVVTTMNLYILIQEKKNEFKIKSISKLAHIRRVEAAAHNTLLVNFVFKNK